MSDLISREAVLNLRNLRLNDKEIYKAIYELPSADIMECARAIKEYCRDRDNLDEPCEGCPFHFYDGFAGFCVLNYGLYPNEWYKPEGEEGGAE